LAGSVKKLERMTWINHGSELLERIFVSRQLLR